MRKIYLDTNVILEHALQRSNFRDVASIFHLSELGIVECFTSASTFFTIAYFLRKQKDVKKVFNDYFSFIKVITTSQQNLLAAVNSSFVDIEDGFHYYSAVGQCDAFITFNKKHFEKHQNIKLKSFTPAEFLKLME